MWYWTHTPAVRKGHPTTCDGRMDLFFSFAHKNLTELTKLQLLIRKQHSHIIANAVGFNSYRRDITPQIRVLHQHAQTEQVKTLPNKWQIGLYSS